MGSPNPFKENEMSTEPRLSFPTKNLGFGGALSELRKGRLIARAGWNGKDMWIALQMPDAKSKMTLPYIFMKTADGALVPWLASQTDILASDWFVF